ncbi:MAG: type II toxin-antitoxin system VapC family toxin [Desulfobacterales bacterium]|nr:type II toxin-antitoxin system VapC family toxin [Desulfobacterales bacterium]
MNNVILDVSALLALLNEETGADKVARFIPGAVINTVNLSEIIAKLAENGMPEDAVRGAIDMLDLKVMPFDTDLSYKTGILRLSTKDKGLSLGDRACLASGLIMNLPVLTCDKIWQELDLSLDIRIIR